MLLAKSFSVPVEPVKQMSTTIVATEGPFVSVTGTSSVQTTDVVTQVSSSQHLTGTSSGQVSGLVTQPTMMNQLSDVTGVMPLVKPSGQATSQDVTSATASPDVQFNS